AFDNCASRVPTGIFHFTFSPASLSGTNASGRDTRPLFLGLARLPLLPARDKYLASATSLPTELINPCFMPTTQVRRPNNPRLSVPEFHASPRFFETLYRTLVRAICSYLQKIWNFSRLLLLMLYASRTKDNRLSRRKR
ncbi:MAG: hypothetical protein WBL40_01560, partial [Terrimicrobiaceae bacterium]